MVRVRFEPRPVIGARGLVLTDGRGFEAAAQIGKLQCTDIGACRFEGMGHRLCDADDPYGLAGTFRAGFPLALAIGVPAVW